RLLSMSWAEKFIFRVQVFTVGMAVICPSILVWMALNAKRQIDSYNWPEAPGIVESTTAKTWLDDKKVIKYFGRVVYRYSVNGQEYTSDLTDLGPGMKRIERQAALADVSLYQPGGTVTVYYDPNDPSVGVIEKGIPAIHKVILIALSIGSIIFLLGS